MIVRTGSVIPKHLAWIIVLAVTMLGTSLRAGDITGIVAFGDSLSDVGNTYHAFGYPPSPPYYQGHYSNGPIWLEYLAGQLGVAVPTPSLAGGTDNAWGFAKTGDGSTTTPLGPVVPNIGTQISTYLASNTLQQHPAHHDLGRGERLLEWRTVQSRGPRRQPDQRDHHTGRCGGQAVPGAQSPLARGTSRDQHNIEKRRLECPHNGVRQHAPYPARPAPAATWDHDPSGRRQFGVPEHHRGPGCIRPHQRDRLSIADGNHSGQGYLFWDTVHPTTVIQELIGAAAFATVPEPSSLMLVLIAAPLLLAWRRRAAFTSPGPRPRDGSGRA